MTLATKRLFAFALLACVIFIVVHPLVDMPETTLRSKITANVFFYAIISTVFLSALLFRNAREFVASASSQLTFCPAKGTLSALRC